MTEKNTIIKELRNLARHMFVGREGDVYIYGSQALGNASEGSDWDILIITDDSVSTADDFTKYAFPFCRAWMEVRTTDHTPPLHPHPMGKGKLDPFLS